MSDIETILNIISNMKPDTVLGTYGFIVLLTYTILKYSVYLSLVYLLYMYLKNKSSI